MSLVYKAMIAWLFIKKEEKGGKQRGEGEKIKLFLSSCYIFIKHLPRETTVKHYLLDNGIA